MEYKLDELAKIVGVELKSSSDLIIRGINKIDEAEADQISFLHNPKYFEQIKTTRAKAVIVPIGFEPFGDIVLLEAKDPYMVFLQVLQLFHPPKELFVKGVNSLTDIHPTAKIGQNPSIAAFVSIAADVEIGDNVQISPNVTIGHGVKIGNNVIIHSNCAIRESCLIGNGVILQNGAIIGSDGFGFAPDNDKYAKIPQVGNVIIEDNVEIGANTVVDRATLGSTIISQGTKLDNLIQIAHNVRIGKNVVMAAQTGVSGSTKIGDHCMIGGQVGFVGHIKIGNGVMIGAQAGVAGNVKDGSIITGTPARDLRKMRTIDGALGRLPDLIYKVRDLEKEVAICKETLSKESSNHE